MKIKLDVKVLIGEIEKEIKSLRKENRALGRKNLNDAYARNTMCLVGMYRVLEIVHNLRCEAIYEDIDNYIEKHKKKTVDSDAV